MTSKSRPKSRRIKGFTLAFAASMVLGALIVSSASALSIVSEDGKTMNMSVKLPGIAFSVEGGENFACTGGGGAATFPNGGTGGTAQLVLTGCVQGVQGLSCTGSGLAKGEILTKALNTSLVYLDAAKTKFGLAMVPATSGGPIAEYTCSGGLSKQVLAGGVLGEITSPSLNTWSNAFVDNFQSDGKTPYIQKWRVAEENWLAPPYYLPTRSVNGGSAKPIAWTTGLTFNATSSLIKFLP